MSYDNNNGPIYVGVGYGLVAPAAEPKPVRNDREYVAGSRGIIRANAKQALSQSIDSLTRQFGWLVYDGMMCDPIVSASFDLLRLLIIGDGPQYGPTHPKLTPDAKDTPETTRSQEVADYCTRLMNGCDRPQIAFLWEALEALVYGNKLAEKVYRLQDVGEDKGQMVLAMLKFKPLWTWLFVTDGRFNELGIMAWTADETGVTVIPRDKFCIFTHQSRNGDPRGTSMMRPIYEPWNEKTLTWPDYTKFRNRFGSPKPVGETAEGEKSRIPTDGNGKPIAGATPISAQEYLANLLIEWFNDSIIAIPSGTKIHMFEPKGEGKVYTEAIALFDRQIVHGILGNTRTTMEAEHGSKADSETGQDVTQTKAKFYRKWLAEVIRREILLPAVELRYGKEDAHRYTPLPTFESSDADDITKIASAFATLKTAGIAPDSLIPYMLKRMGMPVPDMDAPEDDAPDDTDIVDRNDKEDKEERREQEGEENKPHKPGTTIPEPKKAKGQK